MYTSVHVNVSRRPSACLTLRADGDPPMMTSCAGLVSFWLSSFHKSRSARIYNNTLFTKKPVLAHTICGYCARARKPHSIEMERLRMRSDDSSAAVVAWHERVELVRRPLQKSPSERCHLWQTDAIISHRIELSHQIRFNHSGYMNSHLPVTTPYVEGIRVATQPSWPVDRFPR